MKVVTSDIKGFEGRVLLKDRLFWEDVLAIENALDKAAEVESSAFWKKVGEAKGDTSAVSWSSRSDRFFIEAIIQCAEKFEIAGVEEKPTADAFPMSPRPLASQFVTLVWTAVQDIYNGEISVPNAS